MNTRKKYDPITDPLLKKYLQVWNTSFEKIIQDFCANKIYSGTTLSLRLCSSLGKEQFFAWIRQGQAENLSAEYKNFFSQMYEFMQKSEFNYDVDMINLMKKYLSNDVYNGELLFNRIGDGCKEASDVWYEEKYYLFKSYSQSLVLLEAIPDALFNLSMVYACGHPVEKDTARAALYFRLAATNIKPKFKADINKQTLEWSKKNLTDLNTVYHLAMAIDDVKLKEAFQTLIKTQSQDYLLLQILDKKLGIYSEERISILKKEVPIEIGNKEKSILGLFANKNFNDPNAAFIIEDRPPLSKIKIKCD